MLHIARWCSVKLCPTKPSAQHMSLQDMGRVLGNRTGVVLLLRLQAQDGKGLHMHSVLTSIASAMGNRENSMGSCPLHRGWLLAACAL